MEQWFGYANRDDENAKGMSEEGGWAAQSDAEIHFKGSLEADSGLKFTVHVELEGDRGSNAIDETFARVSGAFGQLEIGGRDHAMVRMHESIGDVGIGLNAGDTQKWIPGAYLETSGHGIGNARKLNYISPRVSGLQLGVSYAPDDTSQAPASAPSGNDSAGWGVGMNFKQEVGDMGVTFSLGHKSTDTAGSKIEFMSGAAPTAAGQGNRITPLEVANNSKAIDDYEKAVTAQTAGNLQELQTPAAAAVADNKAAMDGMMTKGDASTYTNAGVGVSFGAFKFNVAYATADGGAYTTMMANKKITQEESADFPGTWNSTCNCIVGDNNPGDYDGDGAATSTTAESDTNNDPRNDYWVAEEVVEDKTKNYDVWGVSVTYTDGPMAVSLGHMTHEEDAGGERTATMLSTSYTLAPGVSWRTSVFGVDDDSSAVTMKDGKATGDMMNEGTGFVTGIKLAF